ncbi:hypothetical protein VP01_741g3 [Puccinia sorghi]|uniref:Uncharacterized protein n=1 Tax=Puccinia sorghi TaxID=27349 RepID=A0A0L6UDE2_9BASI|nr:hypothetical protein VP01_741g3 [Puccinia sorghi]
MIWHQVKFYPHNLCSTTPWVDNKPTCHPTLKEVEEAYTQIQSYWFLHSGLNAFWDPLNEDSIIAIIKFTPFNKITPSEKDDLNFISTFLHNTKRTIFLEGTSSSLGLKTRFLLILIIIASPLGLVRLLVNFLKKNCP